MMAAGGRLLAGAVLGLGAMTLFSLSWALYYLVFQAPLSPAMAGRLGLLLAR